MAMHRSKDPAKLRQRFAYREPGPVTTRFQCPNCFGPHHVKACPARCEQCGAKLRRGICTRASCTREAA